MVTLQAVGSKPAAVMVAAEVAEVAEAVHAYEACGVVKEID
jgi:hypothetical protein